MLIEIKPGIYADRIVYKTEQTGIDAYSQGYRFIINEQFGLTWFSETPMSSFGHGCYELNADGTFGRCISSNYDTSD